ncbi:MAG: LPS export ABC transporter permease LptG [Deltaproteobacteria bacterium]|nr:LPS export ABC transporter permease LptG [Deltaproteobacteria bacterium]
MKILDKYIIKEFLKFVGITFISLILIFLIVDFFEKIRMFLGNHATTAQMASYFMFSLPMIISYMLPPSILIATLLTYSSLSKNSEITAMKANGISLYRMSIPPLIFAVFISFFSFFFNELITPASIQKTENIIIIDIQKQKTFGFFKQNELWYRGENAIYNFKMFDVDKNILRGVTINYLNPDFTLMTRIDAQSAEWKNDKWLFYNLLTTRFDDDNAPVLEWSKEKEINIPEKPNDFKIIQKDAEKMGYFELKKYVKKIQTEGYDVQRYLVDLQGKIAVSFVTIILVIIGISFSLRSERSGGIMQSLGIGIIAGFSYFIVHAFCITLGRSGILPGVLAAWAANILFSSIAALLFYRVRT